MTEESEASRVCRRCGQPLPAGEKRCPNCDNRVVNFLHSRDTVLSISGLLLVIMFFITGFVSRWYQQKLTSLGQQWFERGQMDLKSGDATAALADFRNALVYTPDDSEIEFRLAEALSAENRDVEARAYLHGLLEQSPSSAPVNLALARIAAHEDSEPDALRYYHGAIYGIWPDHPETNRLNTRLELCEFLIDRGDKSSAEAELIAFAGEIPALDTKRLVSAGDLFVRAGDLHRAFAAYRRALAAQPNLEDGLRGAGLVAFQLGDFLGAERYLDHAHRLAKNDSQITATLETSRELLAVDPFLKGLSEADRRVRVRRNFEQAYARLRNCARSQKVNLAAPKAPPSDFSALYAQAKAFRPKLRETYFIRHPDQLGAAMKLVFQMEDLATEKCGAPQGADHALTVLEQFNPGGQP